MEMILFFKSKNLYGVELLVNGTATFHPLDPSDVTPYCFNSSNHRYITSQLCQMLYYGHEMCIAAGNMCHALQVLSAKAHVHNSLHVLTSLYVLCDNIDVAEIKKK